ncbi:hypothetical protein AgCh_023661 [Apium graveolens]
MWAVSGCAQPGAGSKALACFDKRAEHLVAQTGLDKEGSTFELDGKLELDSGLDKMGSIRPRSSIWAR